MTESVTRYVCTILNRDGQRTLMNPAQGRFSFETREEAQAWLDAVMSGNSARTIEEVFGIDRMPEVRACPCYPGHFDPQKVWFD